MYEGKRQLVRSGVFSFYLLNCTYAALVASGTAALEKALFNGPQTVLYKVEGGWLMDILMRNIVLKTEWASLPNIILGKSAVRELIQKEMTLKKVKCVLNKLLFELDYRDEIFQDYNHLKDLMCEPGCSKLAAFKMVNLLASGMKKKIAVHQL